MIKEVTLNWKKTLMATGIAIACANSYAQTLEQAVAITLATNPNIKAVFNEFKSAVKQNDAAGGAYLPSIDLDAGIGYFWKQIRINLKASVVDIWLSGVRPEKLSILNLSDSW